jgi:hypothetical protein
MGTSKKHWVFCISIIRIKADRDERVGFMLSMIDEVRLSDVKNFSIVTERN